MRQTVIATNNAYDSILLVNERQEVIGAWTATPDLIDTYLSDGANASEWDANWPDQTTIADYGTEIGRDGRIEDSSRREFWGVIRRLSSAAPILR